MKTPADKPLQFLRAAEHDTAIATSLLDWLDHEREKAVEAMIVAVEHDVILRMQGKVVAITGLRRILGDWTRSK